MSSKDEADQAGISIDPITGRNEYIELMRRAMRLQRVSLRELATRTGIGKSRLGLLLHPDSERRPEIALIETKIIFDALDIDVFCAVICVEVFGDIKVLDSPRHHSVISLLRIIYRWLPVEFVQTMAEYDHIDGTDVRPEWAVGLQRAFVRRVVNEISRRAAERLAGWERDL